MVKLILAIAISPLLLLLAVITAGAQYQTDSNTIRTTVGNPAVQASSCPIPNGISYCGSKNHPIRGCGHCGIGYGFPCDYPSLQYALDVAATYGQEIFLPEITGQKIKWTWVDQQIKSDGITSIQRYSGTNEKTGDQYWIQFHHTAPGSGSGTKMSGEVGARICRSGCDVGTGPHVHIEFANVTSTGLLSWVDAPLYFCPQ